MSAFDEQAKQALSVAGAMCGDCGDEPGDRKCRDCERCLGWYVDALRKAGWAPRAELLNEAADVAEDMYANGINGMRIAKRLCAMAAVPAPPVPDNTTGDETELTTRAIRAVHKLKSPPPSGSQHYRSGWDDGLEAAIDAIRAASENGGAK